MRPGIQPCFLLGVFPRWQANVGFGHWRRVGGMWHLSGCVIASYWIQRPGPRTAAYSQERAFGHLYA